jgi:O-antigen/teichoic acid export membrane protein
VACAALQIQRFCTGVSGAFESFGYENMARILQGASFALGLVLLRSEPTTGPASALMLLAGSQALAALFLAGSLQWRHGCFGRKPCLPGARDWLAEAVPLGLGDVLRGLTWQVDTIILGLLQPAAAVAIYSVAYRSLGPINWVPLAILTAAFPSFARLADGDRHGLRQAFAASSRVLWLASLPIVVFFCVRAEPIILLVAGPEYLDATLPMRLVIGVTSLSFLSYPFRYLFTVLGRQRAYAILVAAVLGFQTVALLILVPCWGYLGACAGALMGQLAFTATGLWMCSRLRMGTVEWGQLARGVIAAAAMVAVLSPVREVSWPVFFVALMPAFGLYVVLCVALGALGREEVGRFCTALVPVRRPVAGPRVTVES